MTKTYGLLGHNISYSLSPAMHNAAFKKLRYKAQYKIFDVVPEQLDEFLNGLLRSDINGLNVTVPYKTKAFDFVRTYGTIARDVEKFGAINTIVIKKKTLFGYNTDATGFMRSIKVDLKFDPKSKNIFIFGAGGAGSACAIKLAESANTIFVFDIDNDKIRSFSDRFLSYYGREKLSMVERKEESIKEALMNCHLLINATPFGKNENEMLVNPAFLHNNLSVFDLTYKPSETPIIKEARKMGLKAVNGSGMLLYQGAAAFELWTGRKAPIKTMRNALEQALEAKQ